MGLPQRGHILRSTIDLWRDTVPLVITAVTELSGVGGIANVIHP
jgi:hypothetical protein